MVPKNVCTAIVCATLLAWGGASAADEYRAGRIPRPRPFNGGAVAKTARTRHATSRRFRIEARADRAKPGGAGAPRTESGTQDRSAENAAAKRARKTARRGSHEAGAAARQSARCAGVRYAGSGLAVQVGRHLQLEAVTSREPIRRERIIQRVHEQIAAQHQQHGQRVITQSTPALIASNPWAIQPSL